MNNKNDRPSAVVIGGGPAGLMAAEQLAGAGLKVTLYDRMPTVGRKFLMAGRGGLNLTHSEDIELFLKRYGSQQNRLAPVIRDFSPAMLTAWAEGLGQPTFTGSSGRVFPKALKASPLLRAWIGRLNDLGVKFRLRQNWLGWDAEGRLQFSGPAGEIETARPDVTILALGGASWPRLGSNGAWVDVLGPQGVGISPLRPANCGFQVNWSETFKSRFQGQPLKTITLSYEDKVIRGEALITGYGIEGSAVYALSPALREATARTGRAVVMVDLHPDISLAELTRRLDKPKGSQPLTNFLRKTAGLSPLAINLMREGMMLKGGGVNLPSDPADLAALIKAVPLKLTAPQPLARAISTAGGIYMQGVDEQFMLHALPGVFVAGEMLDWEAPTGGYLLQATFATAVAAAKGALAWLENKSP
jgi:uncharacterized flavoprotein (TIGR03862 family)